MPAIGPSRLPNRPDLFTTPRLVERVLAACESADSGDIAPLITLLRRFGGEAAREEARLFCDEIAEPPRLVYSAAA